MRRVDDDITPRDITQSQATPDDWRRHFILVSTFTRRCLYARFSAIFLADALAPDDKRRAGPVTHFWPASTVIDESDNKPSAARADGIRRWKATLRVRGPTSAPNFTSLSMSLRAGFIFLPPLRTRLSALSFIFEQPMIRRRADARQHCTLGLCHRITPQHYFHCQAGLMPASFRARLTPSLFRCHDAATLMIDLLQLTPTHAGHASLHGLPRCRAARARSKLTRHTCMHAAHQTISLQ